MERGRGAACAVFGVSGFLLDGGYITVPEEAMYGVDSQWAIENHGVDPDIPVDDTPGDWCRDTMFNCSLPSTTFSGR